VFYPTTRDELAALVRTAAEEGRGLVPVSSGAPHIRGGSVNPGAETVSFEKMNRILAVNRHDRYVRVESGVTFGQLLPEVKKAGLRLNAPFLPRANKSVVAAALEREAVLVPKYQYDYTDPLLNVETVYGRGEVFHTGSAAGPGPVEELKADMVAPWGPGCIDFVRFLMGAQGTMGLVTWGTLKAEVLPTQSVLYFVEADELSALTELAYRLNRDRVPDDCIILNNVSFAAAFGDSAAEEAQLRAKCAPWTLLCRICGYERYPERRIAIYEGYLHGTCAALGLQAAKAPKDLPELAAHVDAMLGDCDRRETYWKLRRGALREVGFLARNSRVCGHVKTAEDLCAAAGEITLGVTVQPQVQGRSYRVTCDLMTDAARADAAEALGAAAEKALFADGAFFDCPYSPALWEAVFAARPASTDMIRRLKDVFDPAHIFNPGKLGL